MIETTHTTAGLLAHAGAARHRVAALAAYATAGYATAAPATAAHVVGDAFARPGVRRHEVLGQHQPTSWTKGAFGIPTTFMVLDRKNRPSRPLLERSP